MQETPKTQPEQNQPEQKKPLDEAKEMDDELERELEDTFPASDPPSTTQPKTTAGAPDHSKKKSGS